MESRGGVQGHVLPAPAIEADDRGRARDQIAAMIVNWRGCLFVGITSVIGSAGWFTAMTVERAAYVKALGQIEMIFTLLLSVLFFKERSTPKELSGMALVAGSIVILLLYG